MDEDVEKLEKKLELLKSKREIIIEEAIEEGELIEEGMEE